MAKRRKVATSYEHQMFRASAGTGKTYQLSNRFLELLFAGVSPEDILATTFTRKAAGEILSRVLLRLAEATSDAKARTELQHALGLKELPRERCLGLLMQTLQNLHRLRISTLDAFFLQLAGAYGWELNFPPGWTISDEIQDARLRDEAIDEVLNEGDFQRLLTLFHLLTKGTSARAVTDLISQTVTDLYSLYQEAPPEAWQKLQAPPRLPDEKIESALQALQSYSSDNKRVQTAIAGDVERAVVDIATFLDKGLAAKIATGEYTYYGKPLPDDLVELYQPLIKHCFAVLVGRLADQTRGTQELLSEFHQAYDARKDEQQLLRFDDITRRLAQATTLPADGSSFRLNGRIEHLLLDEFQDTSLAQWQVLRPFAKQATQRGSLFVVGDTKQAIYGWRGGLAEIFDALAKELPELTSRTLSQSYRSSPVIMDLVNRVFQNMASFAELDQAEAAVRAWQNAFPEHSTARSDFPGYAVIQVSPDVPDGADKAETHLQFAADQVAAIVQRSPGRSVGVLCRTNATVAQLIYLLRRLGIPASEEGGNALDDSAPVELILSLLKLIDHPADTVARFHVAKSPLADPLQLTQWRAEGHAARFAAQQRRQLLQDGYGPVVLEWARKLAPISTERDRNRLQQLVELAYDYQPQSTLRTSDFIATVRETRISDPIPVDVRVMTIHQSKGLEFDVVVLPEITGALSGRPPSFVVGRPSPTEPVETICRYTSQEVQQLLPPELQKLFDNALNQRVNQALCTLYVALTRAAHALHIVLPPSSKSAKLSANVESILRVTLVQGAPLVAGTEPFQLGDPNWAGHSQPDECSPADEPLPTKIELAPLTGTRLRGWQRVAPSQLEGLWEQEAATNDAAVLKSAATKPGSAGPRVRWTDLFGRETNAAMCRGTLFHAWYELVEWLDDGLPTAEAMQLVAQRLAATIAPLADDLPLLQEAFLASLTGPQLGTLLRRSSVALKAGQSVQVEREFPFALRVGSDLVQGFIDRLVLTLEQGKVVAAEIIDFKTDALPPGNADLLAERVAFYAPQLAAYSKAVQLLFHLEPRQVTQKLAFVGSDVVQAV